MSEFKSPQEKQAEALRALVKQAYVKPQAIEKRDEKRAKEGYYTLDYYHTDFDGGKFRIGQYDSRTNEVRNSAGTYFEKPSFWDSHINYSRIDETHEEKHSYTHEELQRAKKREMIPTLAAAAFLIATGGKHERNLVPRLPAFGALLSSLDPENASQTLTEAQQNAFGYIRYFSQVANPGTTEIGKRIVQTLQNLREGYEKQGEKTPDAQIREIFGQVKPPFLSNLSRRIAEAFHDEPIHRAPALAASSEPTQGDSGKTQA